jgi:cardiolipin synthase
VPSSALATNSLVSRSDSLLLDQALTRASGAEPIPGNRARLLCDARENYPAWLDAIARAERWIHFETYIIHDDAVGLQFAEALAAKAREGVRVRVLYDWYGTFKLRPRRFWRVLRDGGAEVRCFNPPHFETPFAWMSRDHRKVITIDGHLGYVTGLCVGSCWVGDEARGVLPWRDTGLELAGPAVAEVDHAFASMWREAGDALPSDEIADIETVAPAGDLAVRVIATVPASAGLYRLDQLIATAARQRLWLTDAYFVATTPYVQALRSAASDGVDVRLLVPSGSDVPFLRAMSVAAYRPLLEGGVRVFEWNGSMLHAKTAVADGRWSRVGSTNLNPSSWIGNWELDVAIDDEKFARLLEEKYEEDLQNSTEIVLTNRQRVRPLNPRPLHDVGRTRGHRRRGSAGRATAGAIGIGSAVGAAMRNRRALGPSEARPLGVVGFMLLLWALAAANWPRSIAWPFAVIVGWWALSLLVRAWHLRQEGRGRRRNVAPSAENPSAEPPKHEKF